MAQNHAKIRRWSAEPWQNFMLSPEKELSKAYFISSFLQNHISQLHLLQNSLYNWCIT